MLRLAQELVQLVAPSDDNSSSSLRSPQAAHTASVAGMPPQQQQQQQQRKAAALAMLQALAQHPPTGLLLLQASAHRVQQLVCQLHQGGGFRGQAGLLAGEQLWAAMEAAAHSFQAAAVVLQLQVCGGKGVRAEGRAVPAVCRLQLLIACGNRWSNQLYMSHPCKIKRLCYNAQDACISQLPSWCVTPAGASPLAQAAIGATVAAVLEAYTRAGPLALDCQLLVDRLIQVGWRCRPYDDVALHCTACILRPRAADVACMAQVACC